MFLWLSSQTHWMTDFPGVSQGTYSESWGSWGAGGAWLAIGSSLAFFTTGARGTLGPSGTLSPTKTRNRKSNYIISQSGERREEGYPNIY